MKCKPRYNLCEQCEHLWGHSERHIMLKITYPVSLGNSCPTFSDNKEPIDSYCSVYSDGLILRQIRQSDVFDILALEKENFTSPYERRYFENIEKKNRVILVADLGGKLVGYVAFELKKIRANIDSIVVSQNYRRRKIAEKLIGKVVDGCKPHRDIANITLHVNCANEPAKHLYTKFGFVEVRIVKQYYRDVAPDEGDAILMAKKLA